MRLLIVDLLAERHGFGREGVKEIVNHFQPQEVALWAPHTEGRLGYPVGEEVDGPVQADVVIITGSRRNVSSWEPWMDAVADLIRTCTVPLYGICFGHQIIAKALGGRIERAVASTDSVETVFFSDGSTVSAVFAHQDHVVDAGELTPIARANHCGIVACVHPTRPIRTVQFHPEVTSDVLKAALAAGEMNEDEVSGYRMDEVTTDVSLALGLPVP